MSDGGEFMEGITVRSVIPGWQATVHHGDGTATSYWAPTEAEARKKAMEAEDDE